MSGVLKTKPREVVIVDKETGEVLEERAIFIGKHPKYVDRGFIKVFVAFLADVVQNEKIAGKAIRLLLYMIEKLNYNTLVVELIPKKAIEELGISRATFYNWLDVLVSEGYLEKIDTYTYRIKPYSFVKGRMSKVVDNSVDF